MSNLRSDPEFQRLERQVQEIQHQRTDFHQRGIGNAADAERPRDYVTRRQLDALREEMEARVEEVEEEIAATLVAGASEPSSTPTLVLPRATHPIAFGYWLADGNIPPLIMREHYDEVKGYTDLYLAWFRIGRQYCDSSGTTSDMMAVADELVRRAHTDGKALNLMLDLPFAPGGDIPGHMDRVLDAMIPYWSRVAYIDLADEPAWTKAELEGHCAMLRSKMTARGLTHPQVMVTLLQRGPNGSLESDMVSAAGLDVVGIEAYVDPPGGTAEQNETALRSFLTQAKARVPADKKISMIIQAYARNGAWTNIETLTALQTVAYMLAYDDPKVVQLSMFSYGRASGTREHPELKAQHQAIWAALALGTQSLPTCGGAGLPAECKRYCRGGLHDALVEQTYAAVQAANPAWFVPGAVPLRLVDEPTANAYVAEIVRRLNLTSNISAIVNPGDGKEAWTKDRVNAQESNHYALWASQGPYEIRTLPNAYRATCAPPRF